MIVMYEVIPTLSTPKGSMKFGENLFPLEKRACGKYAITLKVLKFLLMTAILR